MIFPLGTQLYTLDEIIWIQNNLDLKERIFKEYKMSEERFSVTISNELVVRKTNHFFAKYLELAK